MSKFDVVVVGDLNADLILSGDVAPAFGQVEKLIDDATLTIGGSSGIFACGAARLGLRVAVVGKVGQDPFGDFMLASFVARGIDVTGVKRDGQVKTGLTTVLSRDNDRALLTYSGAIGALRYDEIDLDWLGQADHLHIGSYYLLDSLKPSIPKLCRQARTRGLSVSVDTNYDPTEQWDGEIVGILPEVDIFLPNETELLGIARASRWQHGLAQLAHLGPTIVVKRGAAGADARHGDLTAHAPSPPVAVVDSTGAGDSFDAGFVFGFLAGWPLQRTLAFAAVCGALSTQAVGGTTAQPTLPEAMDFRDHAGDPLC